MLHFSDIEVQTTNSPHRVPLHRSYVDSEQSLINTPFTRDLNIPNQCPSEEPFRHSIFPSLQSMNKRSIQSSESYTPFSVRL